MNNLLEQEKKTITIQSGWLLILWVLGFGGGWGLTQQLIITGGKKEFVEQEILDLNLQLEQRVLERTAELSETIEEIESFSYSVSHDLRAPLRAISGFSEILLTQYSDKLDPEVRKYLNKIHDSGDAMDELITGMLFLSQLSRKKLSLVSFEVGTIVEQIFNLEKLNNPNLNINLIINVTPEILADPNLIKILITNLMSNAMKFTNGSEVTKIEFGHIIKNDEIVYFFKDNGIGFDMDYADKIFSPFQRLHGKDDFEGTGIGLAIAKSVIKSHKGKIWVESEENKGTTFFFTIGLL